MMAKKDPTNEDFVQQMNGALQLFGQAQTPVLGEFSKLQNQRSQRLQKNSTRIAEKLGEDHPRVLALRQTQERTAKLQQNLKDNATRTEKLRQLKPYEWMVYGQVIDSEGKPVPDVIVRVFDKDRKYDDLLGLVIDLLSLGGIRFCGPSLDQFIHGWIGIASIVSASVRCALYAGVPFGLDIAHWIESGVAPVAEECLSLAVQQQGFDHIVFPGAYAHIHAQCPKLSSYLLRDFDIKPIGINDERNVLGAVAGLLQKVYGPVRIMAI